MVRCWRWWGCELKERRDCCKVRERADGNVGRVVVSGWKCGGGVVVAKPLWVLCGYLWLILKGQRLQIHRWPTVLNDW